jgi:hypothetical protein
LPVVTDGDPSIITTDDYTVSYSDNTNAGTATVTITATLAGNYSGTASANFTIDKAALIPSVASVDGKTYDGNTDATGTISLSGAVNGENPTATGTFAWTSANAGTTRVNVTEIALEGNWGENYVLSTNTLSNVTAPDGASISKKALADVMIAAIANQTYTGLAIEPLPVVTDGNPSIITTGDYTVAYSNNTNAGTATVTITATGAGNYSGSASANFTIDKATLIPSVASVDGKTYDGNTDATGTISLSGAVNGENPTATGTFAWTSANAGTTRVNVTDIALEGNWGDNYVLSTNTLSDVTAPDAASISKKALADVMIAAIANQTYTGLAIEPLPVVTDGNPSIITTGDYTVAYSNNTNAGTATVTITATGAGNYSGSASANFTIETSPATVAYTGTRLLATTGDTKFELSARITSLSGVSLLGEEVRFTVKWGDTNQYSWTTVVTIGTAGTVAIVNALYDYTLQPDEASRKLTIDVELIKNFTGDENGDDKEVIAIIYRPNGDHITGGGYLVADAKSQAGEVKPNIGSHTNFGFVFRYQQKGKDKELVLHGEANLVVRQGSDTYTFKATEAVSMGIYNTSAQFSAKVEMRVNNESAPRYQDLVIYATLEDNGNPGTKDLIGFTIWNGNDLIYSSNWEGSYTERKNLGGGNLVIHRGGTTVDLGDDFDLKEENNLLMEKKISVYPNPFRERVNIQFIPASSERAVVSIYSITGALVETLMDGMVEEGQEYKLQFVPNRNNNQVLFYRITIGDQTQTGRIIQQR